MSPLKIQLQEFRRRVVAGSFPQYSNLAAGLGGLRFVQADPIRSPARAQDFILRHRVDSYVSGDLEQMYPQLDAEEGYLFAYGFMQPKVWQDLHTQPVGKLKALERQVLAFVKNHGEVHPSDLAESLGPRSVKNYWEANHKRANAFWRACTTRGIYELVDVRKASEFTKRLKTRAKKRWIRRLAMRA